MNPFASRAGLALAALLALSGCDTPAQDSDAACAFNRRATISIDDLDYRPTTRVDVDGQPLKMLVDTGSTASVITREAANRLKLPINYSAAAGIVGVGGMTIDHPVHVMSWKIGDVSLPARDVAVGDFASLRNPARRIDGVLGMDVMGLFDIDLDLPEHRAVFYDARNCPSGNPAWSEPAMRLPAPAGTPGLAAAYVPANIDGHPLLALIGTGVQISLLSGRFVTGSGLTPRELPLPNFSLNGVTSVAVGLHADLFQSVTIGKEPLLKPVLLVTDLPQGTQMVVGMEFLRERRVWISLLSRMTYIGRANVAAH